MKTSGYSLFELLIALAIVALLSVASAGVFNNSSLKQIARNQQISLESTIKLARQQAIVRRQFVTLCPLQANRCMNQWTGSLSLFSDINKNANKESNEALITEFILEPVKAPNEQSLRWRNNNRFLRFNPSGFINAPGTFKYCLQSEGSSQAFDIIISRSGRIRSTRSSSTTTCSN